MILITNKIFPIRTQDPHFRASVLYSLFDGSSTTHLAGLVRWQLFPDVSLQSVSFSSSDPSTALLVDSLIETSGLVPLKPILLRSNQYHAVLVWFLSLLSGYSFKRLSVSKFCSCYSLKLNIPPLWGGLGWGYSSMLPSLTSLLP